LAAILSAILNFSNRSMMPAWHHSEYSTTICPLTKSTIKKLYTPMPDYVRISSLWTGSVIFMLLTLSPTILSETTCLWNSVMHSHLDLCCSAQEKRRFLCYYRVYSRLLTNSPQCSQFCLNTSEIYQATQLVLDCHCYCK